MDAACKALVKGVTSLPPDLAAARLAAHAETEPPGLRRRALLAARIIVMRKALDAPEPVLPVEVIEVAPVVAEPEPPPPPPVKVPKPLSKGVLMSINLDDVARMLAEPPPEAPKPAEPEPLVAQEPVSDMEGGSIAAVTEEAASTPAVATAMVDLSAQFAAMEEGLTPPAPTAAEGGLAEAALPLAPSEDATAAAPGEVPLVAPLVPGQAAARPPKRAKPKVALADPAAAFAALAAPDAPAEPEVQAAAPPAGKGKPKPLAFDLSAQFAAMNGSDEGA